MHAALDRVLQAARQLGASDVHFKAGLPPIFRIKGDLRTVRDVPPLSREVVAEFAFSMMNDRLKDTFERTWDVDLAYSTQDGARYRVNVFQQRGHVGMVLRLIPPDVPPFEKLNLPKKVLELADEERGLVLVTGITGSGKSTSLAAMVDYINATRACTSSPSRIRSNIRSRTARASSTSARSASTPPRSPRRCARPCGRTRTWCWWARCATTRPPRSP